MGPLDDVVAKLEGIKRQGGGFVARCPAHEDHKQSLSLTAADDGTVLLKCHAGCDTAAIVSAVGIEMKDLFPPKPKRSRRTTAEYRYCDEDGAFVHGVERQTGKKFVQFSIGPDGERIYNLNGVRRVPYRLPELLEGIAAGRWVFVVEGEKDVHTLTDAGFVATCNAGGAGKWRAEWAPWFADARVVVVADNDEAGRNHAEQVAASLAPVAALVKVLTLDGLAEHGDVTDWFGFGHPADDLKELVTAAPRWVSGEARAGPVSYRPLAELLDAVAAFVRRFVVLRPVQLDTVVLWIGHCHAIRAFYTTGRLFLRSPEPECGKSLLFDVMETLVPPDPILDVSISPAALYRSLGGDMPPVVMLDEIDKTIGRAGSADSESLSLLLAVVNGGYRRGRSVRRCVGRDHQVTKFPIFAPVAFAGISPKLDRAALTRSIVIEMQRRAPDEPIAEYVAWDAVPAGEALRDELAAWAEAQAGGLQGARPERPEGIVNRLAECWTPLLVVGEAAGEGWAERARTAALALCGIGHESDQTSLGIRLLGDLQTIFGDREAVWTADLLAALNDDDEAPWSGWNDGAGINARDLAYRLKTYRIHKSADIWIDETTRKGYRRAWFEDAWKRYAVTTADDLADDPVPAGGSQALGGEEPVTMRVARLADGLDLADGETPQPAPGAGPSGPSGYSPPGQREGSARELWERESLPTIEEIATWERRSLAALDPDDENHGLHVAQIRAEAARARKAAATRHGEALD